MAPRAMAVGIEIPVVPEPQPLGQPTVDSLLERVRNLREQYIIANGEYPNEVVVGFVERDVILDHFAFCYPEPRYDTSQDRILIYGMTVALANEESCLRVGLRPWGTS